MTEKGNNLSWQDFQKVAIRVGTILEAEHFDEAKKPAYKLKIDFGSIGLLKSSAQITDLYKPENLIGKQIVAVINFPTKQIANFFSECLVLGAVDSSGLVTLLEPGKRVQNGLRIG